MTDLITYELKDGIALIGLNRVAKRNALNRDCSTLLASLVARAGEEARVAILFGHGQHFCAGLDLAEAAELMNEKKGPITVEPGTASIARSSIPIICALQGAVIGGGLELAAACHLRVCAESAFFGLPEAQRGIFVGGGGTVRIARLIGVPVMTDMMLTGRVLNATEAERIGLAQYRTADDELMNKANELALRMASNSPLVNFAVTNGLPRIQDMSYDDGLFVERLLVSHVTSEASATGIQDFLSKKAPRLKPT